MNYKFSSRMDNLKASAIREILKLTADPNVISFAAGSPSIKAFPNEIIEKITADILKNNPFLALQYNITEGYAPLREVLKEMMKTRYNMSTENNNLVVTTGAQQAIELTTKVLINKGDTIIAETPTFLGSLNSFKSYEANLVGVPVLEDGIDILELEKALITNENTKFIYVIPNFQNPTGVTMSFEKRKAVYALASKYDVLILEDNPYGDLRFTGEHIPTIKSMDTENRVIYCGSFSKVLSPGLRVGYCFAPDEIIEKVVVCKQCADVHTTILSQMICYEFLTKYNFDEHISYLCDIYKHKAQLMMGEMAEKLDKSITFTKPEGGLFIWCTLPQDVDMMEFCKTAVLNKVAVVPGSAFLTDESIGSNSFRVNFSTPSDEDIVKGIDILSKIKL